MLKEITIESYKSLKNVTVQFKDGLNIIIGKNGSGKSNLLEFIDSSVLSLVPAGLHKNRRIGDNYSYIVSHGSKRLKVAVRTEFDANVSRRSTLFQINTSKFEKYISISFDSEIENNVANEYLFTQDDLTSVPEILRLNMIECSDLEQLIRFNVPESASFFKSGIKYTISISNFFTINSEDDNFLFGLGFRNNLEFGLLAHYQGSIDNLTLLRNYIDENFDSFKQSKNIDDNLKLFSPIEELRISPNVNIYNINDEIIIDNLTIEYKLNNVWVPWSYLSDGTKRLFYLISEICCQESGFILIEEPELGIHPRQLYKLMQFIKEQSKKKQIIISTHSPLVLDTLEEDELDRIIIAKIENGSSKFEKLTAEQMKHAKEYMHEQMDLSFYWLHANMEG